MMYDVASRDLGPSLKTIAGTSYFHRDGMPALCPELRNQVWTAEDLCGFVCWNVAKIRTAGPARLSLLQYQEFDEPFPALIESVTVDLERRRFTRRSYRSRSNPPILHRKELLLSPSYPGYPEFVRLTSELEELGLLGATRGIGTRLGWERRLSEAGIRVIDHQVERADRGAAEPAVMIRRHLAAIRRDGLSSPIQALIRHRIIEQGTTVFDYGCGYGSDIEGLRAAGITASGWDPYYAPDEPRTTADVVNLGFVLNVIERPSERVDVLRSAFALARRCLAVAVITPSRARADAYRPYGDGFITRIGTFQKFFRPAELKALIERTLEREAIPAGPGLFFVFSDPVSEQEFLVSKQTRRPATRVAVAARRAAARDAIWNSLKPVLEALATISEELGRDPKKDELPRDLLERLSESGVSLSAALRAASDLTDRDALETAADQRRADLQVYLALNSFNRRPAYKKLPHRLQQDVRAFFGSYAVAQAAGQEMLFSLAQKGTLDEAALAAVEAGIGQQDADGNLWAAVDLVPRLPAVLRCYAGCAEKYAGGLDEAHLVKFHLRSFKLSLFQYPDFSVSPLPRLELRTKIDLRRQRIMDFDHSDEDQRLLFKSRFMMPDQAGYELQKRFDEQADRVGLGEFGSRATGAEIAAASRKAGYILRGWKWAATSAVPG